ncbi:hypothetical protein FZC66_14790 [Priestia megaterium]|nr:hypothetical protein FZC66_14790 [Priestia megaterium]
MLKSRITIFLIVSSILVLWIPASVFAAEANEPAGVYTAKSYLNYLHEQGEEKAAQEFEKFPVHKQQEIIYFLNHPDEMMEAAEVEETFNPNPVTYEESADHTEAGSSYAVRSYSTAASSKVRKGTYTAEYKVAGFTTTKVQTAVIYRTSGSRVTSVKGVSGKVIKNVNPLVSISRKQSRTWISSNRAYGQIDWEWKVGPKKVGTKRQTVYGTASGASGGSSITLN